MQLSKVKYNVVQSDSVVLETNSCKPFILLDNEDMVKLVINHKADINFKERLHGFTPLHLAVHNSKFN